MNRYDEARHTVGRVLKEQLGSCEAIKLLTDVIIGAGWEAIERAHDRKFPEADKYLRGEK